VHKLSITGKKSKLAWLFEDCIREQTDVEIELINKEIVMGTIKAYELSTSQCFVVVADQKNRFVINFNRAIRMRVPNKSLSISRKDVFQRDIPH